MDQLNHRSKKIAWRQNALWAILLKEDFASCCTYELNPPLLIKLVGCFR
jgi:hypothetical protein